MNNINDYYILAEHEIKDPFQTGNDLLSVAAKSTPEEILSLLIENSVLNNCKYRDDQIVFWSDVSLYKFDKLGFASPEKLNTACIEYIKTRLAATKNTLLIAKYNHILWHSSEKDKHIYGQRCIDSYLEYITSFLQKNDIQGKDCGRLINYVRAVDKITWTLKHKKEDFRSLLKNIVQKKEVLPEWFVFYVIQIAYDLRSEFDEQFNLDCFLCLEYVFKKEDNSSIKDDIYSYALKYGNHLKKPVLYWHDLMGYYYLSLASNREQSKGDFLIPQYYARAINYFKLADNKEMHSELSANFQKVKSANELPCIPFSFPLNETLSKMFSEDRKNFEAHIASLNLEELIQFICTDGNLIPHIKIAPIRPSFMDFGQRSNYDRNNNFNHSSGKDFINSKTLEIQLFIMDRLKESFKQGIETKKMTSEILIAHLENNSWMGKNESAKYWITLLKPGISSFFALYNKHLSENVCNQDEIIITLDTLAIKVEGIVRTFASLNKVNITKIEGEKSKGSKDVETREAFMHELFTDQYPDFKSLFDDNEYEFFKYLYLKGGQNIRNDIAHSFYKPEDYTIEKTLLVVLSIFRISQYKIKE